VEQRDSVIKGHVDLNFLTDAMLAATKFAEYNYVAEANGTWKELGIPQPDYPSTGPNVLQSFDSACPAWAHQIKDMFTWVHHKVVTLNCLTPGCFIPPHRDELYRLKQSVLDNKLDVKNLTAVRVNVLLQDKKHGHFLDVNNQTIEHYAKGDYVYIFPGVLHSVANVGYENRYTLQVTGYADLG